ncbi:MAG TPA: choice-of-anchor X domain-containing protein [Pyrinomonadaceae bacterium]|nr:choice-of-anchor X domain-containing protein [Pyrinomonadaceae bacterium]
MRKSWSNMFKLCAIVLALSLFAGSIFFTGTNSFRTTAASASATTSAPATATTAAVQEDDSSPQIESMSATPLKEPTAEGNAVLFVQFAADQKVGSEVKTVIDDRDVLLRDDGTGGDSTAGDGTYSAVIFIDFEELAKNQDEIQAINAQPEPTPEATATPINQTDISAANAASASDAESQSAFEQQGATATAVATTEEEREDTNLASNTSIVMPDFDGSRDLVGKKSVPLVDFRNVQPGQIVPLTRIGTWRRVIPEKSLVITNVNVVEDPDRTFNPCTRTGTPMGRWTFGYLMTQMANQPATGIHPSTFVRKWLDKWMTNQTVNGWTVAQRQKIKTLVIDPWVAASGGPSAPLNLSIAPFKLLAIVNRVDLRSAGTGYGGGNAGEGRFVFGLIDRTGGLSTHPYTSTGSRNCRETQFTVIFEYGIDRRGCGIRDWGRQWYNLKWHVLGSPSYNAALQAITDQFTAANVAPHKPNGSALNQLRTNEVELLLGVSTNPVWELREFRIGGEAPGVNPGQLEEVTVKQTPDLSRNRTSLLTNYVNLNTPSILTQTHNVPLIFMSQLFRGGSSLAPRNPTAAVDVNTHWNNHPNGPFITNRQARHLFSLNTCNACHTGETNTVFTHIKPAPFGTEAKLSGFMNGITPGTGVVPFKVVDPADGAPTRKFNEFRRRRIDLDKLVHSPCFFNLLHHAQAVVH